MTSITKLFLSFLLVFSVLQTTCVVESSTKLRHHRQRPNVDDNHNENIDFGAGHNNNMIVVVVADIGDAKHRTDHRREMMDIDEQELDAVSFLLTSYKQIFYFFLLFL